jgi:hypothetical protein
MTDYDEIWDQCGKKGNPIENLNKERGIEEPVFVYPYKPKFWKIFTETLNKNYNTNWKVKSHVYHLGTVKTVLKDGDSKISFELKGRYDDSTYWKVETVVNGDNLGRYDWGAVPAEKARHLWLQLKRLGKC